MMLTSPGDKNSSLSTDLLQRQKRDTLPRGDSDVERDQSTLNLSTSKALGGDRVHVSASLGESFDAPEGLSVRYTNGTSVVVQPLYRQDSSFKAAHPPKTELAGLHALRQAARLNALRKPQTSSHRTALANLLKGSKTEVGALDSYAAPLSPLRERDLQALSALFQRDDIYTIEVDINHRLLSLLPEPCWEDDTFALLQEFL